MYTLTNTKVAKYSRSRMNVIGLAIINGKECYTEEIQKFETSNFKVDIDNIEPVYLQVTPYYYSSSALQENLRTISDIVKQVDWSEWFNIYTSRINKRYEYSGIIYKNNFGYYAPIICRGTRTSTWAYDFGENSTYVNISIHSHPITFDSEYRPITHDVPSDTDFSIYIGYCGVLVTNEGVTIYGTYNYDNNNSCCNDNRIMERIGWESLKIPYAKLCSYPPYSHSPYDCSLPNTEFVDANDDIVDDDNEANYYAEELYEIWCDEIRQSIFDMYKGYVVFDYYADYSCLLSLSVCGYITDDDLLPDLPQETIDIVNEINEGGDEDSTEICLDGYELEYDSYDADYDTDDSFDGNIRDEDW